MIQSLMVFSTHGSLGGFHGRTDLLLLVSRQARCGSRQKEFWRDWVVFLETSLSHGLVMFSCCIF